jgi:hypothetical protein
MPSNVKIAEMEAVVRLLQLALPLADKSASHSTAATIAAAIHSAMDRLIELQS